jgi:hypothetical protein
MAGIPSRVALVRSRTATALRVSRLLLQPASASAAEEALLHRYRDEEDDEQGEKDSEYLEQKHVAPLLFWF